MLRHQAADNSAGRRILGEDEWGKTGEGIPKLTYSFLVRLIEEDLRRLMFELMDS